MSKPGLQDNEYKAKVIDLKKIIAVLLSKWYIIVACLIISLSIAYIKLRYTVPLYTSSINVKIDDERGGQISDFFRYGRVTGRIENVLKTESEIIRSRSLSEKTLLAMKDYFTFTVEGNILSTTIYPNTLFDLEPVYIDSSDYGSSFSLNFISAQKVNLIHDGKKELLNINGDTLFIHRSRLLLSLPHRQSLAGYYGIPIQVTINDIKAKAISCPSEIEIVNIKGTSILTISYTSDVPEFATQFVNTLARVYIQEVVNSKSVAAEQTINFIERQLEQLSNDVKKSQSSLAQFKSENKGITPDELSKKDFDQLVQYQTQINIENIRKKLLMNAADYVRKTKNNPLELITLGVDANDGGIIEAERALNDAIMQRISLLQRYTASSKPLIDNEKKINEIKNTLVASIRASLGKVNETIMFYEKLVDDINSNLKNLPQKQQTLINLDRDYRVNEKIFSYLLEKRLETMVSRASIIPNAAIIDRSISASKVFPDDKKNYIVAIAVALLISMSVIGLMRVVYDKIPNKETIEELSRIPVIGVIKKISSSSAGSENDYSIHTLTSPKSIFSESIRGIRTNINFLLEDKKHKIISLTSTVSGEGKTFCTLNLASSLTLLGNKVLIIGCDLRRPKIHLSFRNIDNRTGLTSYIYGKHTIEDIIKTTEYENLFVIPSGPVPPNPSELLQSEKVHKMLDHLKQTFDYVFLDTAPVGLVSDSFPLLQISDINLYIIRAQYSKRDFAIIPDRLAADNEIKHLYTILNSYDNSGTFYASIYKNDYGGYYGGGGYYYYGGYYGSGGYGYYGRKYESAYYSGYYAEEEMQESRNGLFSRISGFFKRKKK